MILLSGSAADIERDALGAGDVVRELKDQLAGETDPARKRVLSLRLEAAAAEEARALQALFATQRTT